MITEIITYAVIAVAVILAIRHLRRNLLGKSCNGCGRNSNSCGNCPHCTGKKQPYCNTKK